MNYQVYVEFALSPNWAQIEIKVLEAAGCLSDGSGAGFGFRDHSWHRLSKEEATEMAARIVALDLEGVSCEILSEAEM